MYFHTTFCMKVAVMKSVVAGYSTQCEKQYLNLFGRQGSLYLSAKILKFMHL